MGVLVIGKLDCHSCECVCETLTEKGIEFKYVKKEELPQEDWNKYRKIALSNKQLAMPILFKNGEYITLEEVIG